MRSPSHPLAPLLWRLSLHGEHSAADEEAVLALPTHVRNLERGQYVVQEGEKPTHSCVIVAGFAIRHKTGEDGARQIVSINMAGGMIDLQNSLLSIADHNVESLSRMKAAVIPREAIIELAFNRPAVGKALWLETLIEGSIAREWIMNIGRRHAPQRLAHFFCEFAYRLHAVGAGSACSYELPMTQAQLADAVGLTGVHVNRVLKALGEAGLVKSFRRSVVIRNLLALAAYGDFRPMYLHLPSHALPAPWDAGRN
jgi:CRP-like cAMP-binding protein